jgi:DNA-binding NarL/FixJ family response regulator
VGLLERARLVVAHPDSVVRAFWCQLVELWGMKVVGTATCGAEAMDVARVTRPGVVLLDSGLTGLPAQEVAHLVVTTLDANVVLAMAPPGDAADHGQRIHVLRTPVSPWEMRRAIFRGVFAPTSERLAGVENTVRVKDALDAAHQ